MVSTMDGSTIMNVSRIAVTVQAYGENDYATVYHILGDEYLESNEKLTVSPTKMRFSKSTEAGIL